MTTPSRSCGAVGFTQRLGLVPDLLQRRNLLELVQVDQLLLRELRHGELRRRKSNGQTCTAGCECASGNCVDGRCCNNSCTGSCRACNVPGSLGTGKNHARGSDPENGCGLYTCTGNGTCYAGCSGVCTNQCNSNAFCAAGSCIADLPGSGPCLQGCMCQSNTCGAPLFGCLP